MQRSDRWSLVRQFGLDLEIDFDLDIEIIPRVRGEVPRTTSSTAR